MATDDAKTTDPTSHIALTDAKTTPDSTFTSVVSLIVDDQKAGFKGWNMIKWILQCLPGTFVLVLMQSLCGIQLFSAREQSPLIHHPAGLAGFLLELKLQDLVMVTQIALDHYLVGLAVLSFGGVLSYCVLAGSQPIKQTRIARSKIGTRAFKLATWCTFTQFPDGAAASDSEPYGDALAAIPYGTILGGFGFSIIVKNFLPRSGMVDTGAHGDREEHRNVMSRSLLLVTIVGTLSCALGDDKLFEAVDLIYALYVWCGASDQSLEADRYLEFSLDLYLPMIAVSNFVPVIPQTPNPIRNLCVGDVTGKNPNAYAVPQVQG